MAAPFPTRDPRCLQIIANVLYALPPAQRGDGGCGVLGTQDGGAQAPPPEMHLPGRGGERRGGPPPPEVPRPGRGGERKGDAALPEVPRPGRGEERRGDAALPEVPRPGRGGESRVDAPPPEVPRPGRGGESRGHAPRPEAPRPGRGGDGRADAPLPEVPRPVRGEEGRVDAPLRQCSTRCGSRKLEGLGGLARQERTAQGAKTHSNLGAPHSSALKDHLRSDLGVSCGTPWQGLHQEGIAPLSQVERIGQPHASTGRGDWQNVEELEEAPGIVIHDRRFLCIEKIKAAMHKAKGPVSLLRLDTILFDAEQLESLLKSLVVKKVKEVILVNRRWPETSLDFPVDGIDNTEIERLRICFCKIPESHAFQFERLVLLDIAHCLIKSDDLYALVLKCNRLRELHVGYYQEDLRLHSGTLVILQIWYSEMNFIEIPHAPKLQKITVSAIPKSKQKTLCVRIDNSPDLQTIVGNVSNQSFSMKCHDIRRGTSMMPNLKNLYLGVCMSVQKERRYLLNIFKCFTHLEKLVLWRMDHIANSDSEASNAVVDDWPGEIRVCEIVNHIRFLKIEGFKGGECELSIVSSFLKYSHSLRDLVIVSENEDLIVKAKNAFDLPSQVKASYQKSPVAGMRNKGWDN